MPEQGDDPYLDSTAAAKLLGVPLESFRVYLKRSRRRHRENKELRARDLPLPDITIGRSPAWRKSTIEGWQENRATPGRPTVGGV